MADQLLISVVNNYRPPTKWQRLCFHMCPSIGHSVHREGNHDALELTTQILNPGPRQGSDLMDPLVPPPPDIRPQEPTPGPAPLLVTSGGHHWRPAQNC